MTLNLPVVNLQAQPPLTDEICTYARPSDHVDESKSTRLLRFVLWGKCEGIQKRIKGGKIKFFFFKKKTNHMEVSQSVRHKTVACGRRLGS